MPVVFVPVQGPVKISDLTGTWVRSVWKQPSFSCTSRSMCLISFYVTYCLPKAIWKCAILISDSSHFPHYMHRTLTTFDGTVPLLQITGGHVSILRRWQKNIRIILQEEDYIPLVAGSCLYSTFVSVKVATYFTASVCHSDSILK